MKIWTLPPGLSLESVHTRIANKGYGSKSDIRNWIWAAVRSGEIPIHDDLNGGNGPLIVSLVKTADVQEYLVNTQGVDMLTIASSMVAEREQAPAQQDGTEPAPVVPIVLVPAWEPMAVNRAIEIIERQRAWKTACGGWVTCKSLINRL